MAKNKKSKAQLAFDDSFLEATERSYFDPAKLLRPPLSRAAYSDRTAWLMAKLSKLAYLPFDAQGEKGEQATRLLQQRLADGGFELVETFSRKSTQAFLARNPRVGVVAFRGTQKNDFGDIVTDLRTRFYSKNVTERWHEKIHSGFNDAYECIAADLEQAIDDLNDIPLYITGHSLGGALATIAARENRHDHIAAVYTFGSPRVGTADLDIGFRAPVYRIVNKSDMVARLPFLAQGYRHSGHLMYIRGPNGQERVRASAGFIRVYVPWTLWSLATLGIKPIREHRIDRYINALANFAQERFDKEESQNKTRKSGRFSKARSLLDFMDK